MKIFIGQIYGEAGASFPFSHRMQTWLGDQLSSLATAGPEFLEKYGADFALIIRISARTKSAEVEIKGPTVFKETKDAEYSIFLPHDAIAAAEDGHRFAITLLMDGIQEVLARASIEAAELKSRRTSMIENICSDKSMLKRAWSVDFPKQGAITKSKTE